MGLMVHFKGLLALGGCANVERLGQQSTWEVGLDQDYNVQMIATPPIYKQNCFSSALMLDSCDGTHGWNRLKKQLHCLTRGRDGPSEHKKNQTFYILFLWHLFQEMEACPSKVTVTGLNMPIPRDSFKSPNLASRLTPRSSFMLPAGMADSVGGKRTKGMLDSWG